MRFTSRGVARDPEPWLSEDGNYRAPDENHRPAPWAIKRMPYHWAPRPEYNVPVNPILVDIRIYRAARREMNNPKGWEHVLRKFERAIKGTSGPWTDATAEHVVHARKVLTHLANLEALHG
jgi:hypothetical protein